MLKNREVAQRPEYPAWDREAAGSIPALPTNFPLDKPTLLALQCVTMNTASVETRGRMPSIKFEQTPCGYCFSNWATEYDHLTPRSAGGLTVPSNLFPACKRCNCILGNKIFDTLEEKRNYVQERLKKKGVKLVSFMSQGIRGKKRLAKILLFKMPLDSMGSSASEDDATRSTKKLIKSPKRRRYRGRNRRRRNLTNIKALPIRLCTLFKCKREFPPNAENHKFHIRECRIRAFWIKREGGKGAALQEAWEKEQRSQELERLNNG